MTRKVWKQFTPFYFYTVLALSLGVAARISETRSLAGILFLCLTGVLTWGLIEYCLHRFAFHFEAQSEKGRNFVHAMHLSHHENPNAMDDLFAGLRLSLPIVICYCSLAWALMILELWCRAVLDKPEHQVESIPSVSRVDVGALS